MRSIAAAASLLQLGLVSGCAREFSEHDAFPVLTSSLGRRATTFPPQLTEHESILSSSFSGASIDTWSHYYTHGDHVAGRNRSQAQWTADRWAENGIPSSLAEYYVYLNYPKSASIQLTLPNGTVYSPKLIEDPLEQDSVTTASNAIPAFHGYSASGNATAEYVYVGRGQLVDFERLVALGVQLKGKIALAKYGGPFRGLKVKNAQTYGMIGAVIFTDPGDDGNVTEANGYAAYPLGPARNPSGIQRGSVQFLSTYPGDPTTPGYPSKRDSPRADKGPVTPSIPSLPISFRDAIPLLAALDGHGTSGAQVNRTGWIGKLNVTYSTGPAPGAVISMSNLMEDTYTPIWNAVGIINGTNANETIVIGNHRDAWIIGGAADPNSGSAVMIELSKAFGKLLATGWKPKRNIVLASWDAEEYGLVGSTEWMEEHTPWLVETAVANLNIDIAVSGPRFGISATPELHTIAMEIMQKIVYPEGGNRTLYDIWGTESGRIGVLGSGSDYTGFVHRGISAIDMGANNGPNDSVYQYHTNYDTYHWMATYGDPGFRTHAAVGQYLGLLAYHLSSDTVIPYNVSNYATQMRSYFQTLQTAVNSGSQSINISAISSAIDTFAESARQVKQLEAYAVQTNNSALITVVNHKYRDFSRGFTSQGGLPGRPGDFYRHVVFAPGLDTGYAPVTFPGVSESLTARNYSAAEAWVKKTADGILRAAAILRT